MVARSRALLPGNPYPCIAWPDCPCDGKLTYSLSEDFPNCRRAVPHILAGRNPCTTHKYCHACHRDRKRLAPSAQRGETWNCYLKNTTLREPSRTQRRRNCTSLLFRLGRQTPTPVLWAVEWTVSFGLPPFDKNQLPRPISNDLPDCHFP